MQAQMLAPAAVLVLWSIVMLFWTAGSRFSAVAKLDRPAAPTPAGVRGQDLEGVLPDKTNWKSHNYTHLMEQPTIFYPTVVIIAMMGAGATDVLLAWAYVGLRIIHSLWQATVNRIPVRLLLFLLSTLALVGLAVRALVLTLLADPGEVA